MDNERPLQESDLIFSSAASSLKYALGEIKRSNLTITNRLRSIQTDAEFVRKVASAYDLPLVANERCGSWYISPEHKQGSAYFKSTDGHFGQWAFSLRRLNLQIFDILNQHQGCIIVDSTRRGKSMPDALSKTVPIWSTVLNRLLFGDGRDMSCLQTPEDVVSPSEHSQIDERLDTFVAAARDLDLDLDALRTKLQNMPLRVAWVRPNDILPANPPKLDSCNLVVLCTASSRDNHEQAASDYVQGAADDSESWAHGLDAATFWAHHLELLSTSEDDLPVSITSLLSARDQALGPTAPPVLIRPTTGLWISSSSRIAAQTYKDTKVVIVCSAKQPSMSPTRDMLVIHLTCGPGKLGSRQLRAELPKLDTLEGKLGNDSRILVTGENDTDITVGVSLAVLCKFCNQNGQIPGKGETEQVVNKTVIKQRLSWIMVSMPDARPSRATLQSVNAYLMG